MQILSAVASVPDKVTTPTLGTATATSTGFTFSITNYSALNTYVVTTTAGTVSHSSGTVTQAGLGYSTSATVSVYATRTGFSNSDVVTRSGTSSPPPCVPAGCTPPCGAYAYSYTTTCATGQGGAQVAGSCGSPGCTSGCRYYNLDWYVYSAQTCYDNCGVPTTATCSPFSAQSVNATCC